MRKLLCSVSVFLLTLFVFAENIVSETIISSKAPFIPHDNYLVMNIKYKNVDRIYKKLNKYLLKNKVIQKDLIKRGEAHITVITPPEYDNILQAYVGINEINKIALKYNIQNSKVKVCGIGKGEACIGNGGSKQEKTFFLIMKAKDLINIRWKIFEKYKKNGGMPSHFDPENFTPHITIGFTKQDLFEQNGVYKGMNSFYLDLNEISTLSLQ